MLKNENITERLFSSHKVFFSDTDIKTIKVYTHTYVLPLLVMEIILQLVSLARILFVLVEQSLRQYTLFFINFTVFFNDF